MRSRTAWCVAHLRTQLLDVRARACENAVVSDSTNPSPAAPRADASARESAPTTAPKRAARADRTPTTLDGIARAMLRAQGIRSDERLSDQKKVLRGMLRGKYWGACVKAAPKSYGPKGAIKREPNDRRPWGAIPATVAQAIIKGAKR